MFKELLLVLLLAGAAPLTAVAAEIKVDLFAATNQGTGAKLGEVLISESSFGLIFTPALKGVNAGLHGFHIHTNADCAPSSSNGVITPAGAAGGHFDPTKADAHKGPYDNAGRLGDLPALYAAADGSVTLPVLAPRIKLLEQIKQKSLVLHLGGDNYSDQPAPLGGGGARLACGIIK